jgi:hypothetical protein
MEQHQILVDDFWVDTIEVGIKNGEGGSIASTAPRSIMGGENVIRS